jgi:hypothetical protein
MPRAVTRSSYGFGSDTNGPIGAEDFDEEREAIKRRRLLLESMLSQSQTKGMTGLAGGLANLALGVTRGIHNKSLDEQDKELAQRRSEAAQRWLTERPPDIPAQEEVVGTGPLALPPGAPGVDQAPPPPPAAEADAVEMPPANNMTPDSPAGWVGSGNALNMLPRGITGDNFVANRAATPFLPAPLRDTAAWAAQGAGFSPWTAAVAKHAMDRSIDAPIEAEKAQLTREEKAAEKARDRVAREQEKEYQRIETARLAAERAADRRADQDARSADRINENTQRAIDRATFAAGIAGAAEKGTWVDAGTSPSGNLLLRKGTTLVEMVDGSPVPYKGEIVGKGEAKAVEKAMDSAAQLKYTEDLAKRAADPTNAKAFSTKANISSVLSGKTEGFISEEAFQKLTDAQSNIRGEVGRNFAELMHKLYGSAYTANEKASAARFAVLPGMDAKTVTRKLNQQVEFHRQMEEKYGAKVREAAKLRSGNKTVDVTY